MEYNILFLTLVGVEKVQINTDSQNAIRFLTYFIGKWEANGWRNIKGLPVRNQNLIRQLDDYSRLVAIKLVNHLKPAILRNFTLFSVYPAELCTFLCWSARQCGSRSTCKKCICCLRWSASSIPKAINRSV